MEDNIESTSSSTENKPPEDRFAVINEDLSLIGEELLKYKDGEIPLELAKSVAVQWPIRTIQGIEAEFEGGQIPKVLAKHKEWLEEAIQTAREGNFTDSARFLASEGERLKNGMKDNPEWVERDQLGHQLQQAANLLQTQR